MSLLVTFPFFHFFSKFLVYFLFFVMVSFKKVKDVHRWLANREVFEPKATKSKIGPLGQFFDLEYEVPKKGFLISESRTLGGVEDGYFYLVAFASI